MIYDDLGFPPAPADRPYVYANMVTTIDGKTLLGERNESVVGLGSKFDQQVMDRLERDADAIIIGAGSVRANPKSWNPQCPVRIAVTGSGNIPWDCAYLTEGTAYVACPESADFPIPPAIGRLAFGLTDLDLVELLRHLRRNLGIEKLHVLGGSELNAQFLHLDLLDELFLTLAPKIKLGRNVPTYAGGEPLSRENVMSFPLVESHVVENEVFLRYRRPSGASDV